MEHKSPRLIICGDSFNIGIGCVDINTQPYGTLLAKELGYQLINLAKGSSTNLSIWLQVEYAVKTLKANSNDIVIVAETSDERFQWFAEGSNRIPGPISNLDVNYHEYPPYGESSYHQLLEKHPMADDPNYTGTMITENVRGIIDYLDNYVDKKMHSTYYSRLHNEPVKKLRALKTYYGSIHDENISGIQSKALMSMSHLLLRNAGVRHLITMTYPDPVYGIVQDENILQLSWGQVTLDWPDTVDSGHASEQGHIEVKSVLLNKLKENGWA